MLRINRQTDYAIRVLLALARREDGVRLSTSAIQKEMQVPRAMMPRIVAELARARLLRTFPGRDGGLMLSRTAKEITLGQVVEAFEGPLLLSQCLQFSSEDDCPFRSACPVRPKWSRVQAAMMREMTAITFEDLAREAAGIPWPAGSLVP